MQYIKYNEGINMARKVLILIICLMVASPAFAMGRRSDVPSVPLLSPDDGTTIDLTGKLCLIFKWNNAPVPGGGRAAYRFKLIKGFKYDFIVSEELGRDVFSIDVPAEKFENGVTYSWYVEQRDESLMVWSRHDAAWSFKVIMPQKLYGANANKAGSSIQALKEKIAIEREAILEDGRKLQEVKKTGDKAKIEGATKEIGQDIEKRKATIMALYKDMDKNPYVNNNAKHKVR